jgi:hypothetical protein
MFSDSLKGKTFELNTSKVIVFLWGLPKGLIVIEHLILEATSDLKVKGST